MLLPKTYRRTNYVLFHHLYSKLRLTNRRTKYDFILPLILESTQDKQTGHTTFYYIPHTRSQVRQTGGQTKFHFILHIGFQVTTDGQTLFHIQFLDTRQTDKHFLPLKL